ncbi:MAG: damage-inducible protein CinA [Neptuniibacter caesariensis]|uniref:Damage-inducible protein CinA n=1 Tax=Neptuniibacter caesariensis TaxID=207954 RepID=A0A2G6JNH5_NEPCE|nr:MAG: damage-inducible protein CinA [Neptuniibacter caesariensis]
MQKIERAKLLMVAQKLRENNAVVATAESCTGGWIGQAFTSLPGSSSWFDCGFITYSNESKERMLGVKRKTLTEHGAVSKQVVTEMAEAVLGNSQASISVATSGIAGPDGGSVEKPVGTVWIAWAKRGAATRAEKFVFSGDRESVRKQAVNNALSGILQILSC